MAAAIGVSPAYLSALEHGKRGAPSFDFLQSVAGYFNVIWDEAEELFGLAAFPIPKVVLDTSGLSPDHTAFANRLAGRIRRLIRRNRSPHVGRCFGKRPVSLIRISDDPLFSAAFWPAGIWNSGQNPYIREAPSRG